MIWRMLLGQYREHLQIRARNMLLRNAELKANARLKDIHRGERCFILGSGPSIMTQDLTRLAGEIVMTQNHFHAHPDIRTIHPRYHCVVPMYQPPEYEKDWIEWFQTMEERLPADTRFLVGLSSKRLLDENRLLVDRCSYFLSGLKPLFMRRAVVDMTRTIMEIHTVITECITFALYMGFSRIYLLGFDLDQFCREHQPDKVRFYGVSPVTRNEAEKKVDDMYMRTGHTWFVWWLIWKQLILLREEAQRRGGKIINLAPGGLLNCYDRQAYDEVLPPAPARSEPNGRRA